MWIPSVAEDVGSLISEQLSSKVIRLVVNPDDLFVNNSICDGTVIDVLVLHIDVEIALVALLLELWVQEYASSQSSTMSFL